MSQIIKRGVKFGEFGVKAQNQASEKSTNEAELESEEQDFEYEFGWVRDALRDVKTEPSKLHDSLDESQEIHDSGIEASIEIESASRFEDEFIAHEVEPPQKDVKERKAPDSRFDNTSSDVNRRLKLIQKLKDSLSDS